MRRLAVFIILNQHRGSELLTNLPAPIFFVIVVTEGRVDAYLVACGLGCKRLPTV